MSTERDMRGARKEIRKARRDRMKTDRKLKVKIDRQLVADGVAARVEQVKVGLAALAKEIDQARQESEALGGPIKDYERLRRVVSTVLSEHGYDVRDVMLKFAWDRKELGIAAFPSLDAVKTAAKVLGMDEETAFRGMLAR